MIYVDRSRVSTPEILLSEKAEKAREGARAYLSIPRSRRLQERFHFESPLWMQTQDALAELFRNKCAFCETWITDLLNIRVEHFRPKASAVGQPWRSQKRYKMFGTELPDGYWWLAYEWENLYLMCSTCNRNKRNNFPVDGPRARPGAAGNELLKERALLLDPCRDNPERYLHFDNDGHIAPSFGPREESHVRARATIEVLGLNRPDLVRKRHEAANEVALAMKSIRLPVSPPSDLPFFKLLGADKPFLAMRRAFIRKWAEAAYRRQPSTLQMPFEKSVRLSLSELDEMQTPKETTAAFAQFLTGLFEATKIPLRGAHRKGTLRKATTPRSRKKAAPVRPGIPTRRFLGRGGYIQWIEIENFKAIGHLRIEFPEGSTDRVSWKVLLGENGAGKTSVLQAVALALLGRKAAKFGIRPERLLRKLPGRNKQSKEGFVRVQLSKASRPLEMRFDRKSIRFADKSEFPAYLVLRAYSATRLLPRQTGNRRPFVTLNRRVDNLFNPSLPVCDADG